MPPTQSKNSVMKTKPRKITANNTQMPATQRCKIYSELPMIAIQNTCNNIPAINSPARFSKDLTPCFFPDDLEQSFHLGLLSAGATSQTVPLKGLKSDQSSDKIERPENKLILQNCIQSSDSGFGKYALDCKEPVVFSKQSTYDFTKGGKVHQIYLSRKRTNKTGQTHTMTKRFLDTRDLTEDIAYCQTKEKSVEGEDTGSLPQRYENDVPTETDESLKPEHYAFSSKLASESEHESIFTVNVLSKREKHVTFADEVDERQISEPEKCHASEEADLVKFAGSKPKFCKGDDQPVKASDWHQMKQFHEDSDFSDPPFPLSQKYGNHGIVFEDWKLLYQDDLQL